MALTDDASQPTPVKPPPKGEEQRLALRRITQRLKQIQAELERINQRGSGGSP